MMRAMANTKRKKTVKATSRVEVTVDRELKLAWERARTRLEKARREGASSFDELYQAADEIINHDPPYYLAGGIATTGEFIRVYLKEPPRTAMRNMRVARYASPAEEARYTTTKLDAALSYIEAKLAAPIDGRLPIALDKLRFDVERDGRARRVSLEEATVQDVNAATAEIRKRASKPHPKASPRLLALAKALDSKPLRAIQKRVAHDQVWLGRIPIAEWKPFVRALARVKFPTEV